MIATNKDRTQTITEIKNLEIYNYFETINQENFEQTAAMFAETGELIAPFEKPIVGRDAIATYLAKEARGMTLLPERATIAPIENNQQQIDFRGKVKTALFTVNVGWYFILDCQQKIVSARIKLLASPQELLGLKQIKNE